MAMWRGSPSAAPAFFISLISDFEEFLFLLVGELIDFLENGNIKNSVNFPSVSMPVTADCHRLVILHLNIPNMISTITTLLSEAGINIENMANRSKGEFACTLVDTLSEVHSDILDKMASSDGIIRVISVK